MTGGLKVVAFIALLTLAGCKPTVSDLALNGKWRGDIKADGRITPVGLNLRLISEQLEGEFNLLDQNGATLPNAAYRILRTRVEGQKIFFTVPLSGKVEDDSLVLELTLSPNRLDGVVHKRASGSPQIPVTFLKEE
jgi:hypothetical protein